MQDCEKGLDRLLAALSPKLHPERYVFEVAGELTLGANTFALMPEEERVTAIRTDAAGAWAPGSAFEPRGGQLDGGGFRTTRGGGISANVVAALRHDHIFVPWERREDALQALLQLARRA